jgi:DNA-binding response OmpR family regulator
LLAAALKADGFDVFQPEDGEVAFRLTPTQRPDLLVTDLVMPKLDGYALCQQLRADNESASLPILGRRNSRYAHETAKPRAARQQFSQDSVRTYV